jgi:nucleotide-binding universal stress UspA family protein
MINRILVAIDGSSHAKKAVEFAADFASRYDAVVYLLHVVQKARIPEEMKDYMEVEHVKMPPEKGYMETIGKKILEDAQGILSGRGIKKIEKVLLVGDAPQEIVDFAKKENMDVIVLGNQGLGRLKEFLVGTVTNKVFHTAHCTCITVK